MEKRDPLVGHPVYEIIRSLGHGSHGFVELARNKLTGEYLAIKFIPRGWEASHSKYVVREILNHMELSAAQYPHLVQLHEFFLTPRYLAIVMEYVQGATLQQFLEKLGGRVIEGVARFIFQQLVIAVDFCHKKGKVNRDIKLANVLLQFNDGQLPLVKLCDFGCSKDTHVHSEPRSQVGTALFVSPEVMLNFDNSKYDGQAADVWACGVVLFIMLFGRHPFLKPDDAKLSEQMQMIKLFQRVTTSQHYILTEDTAGVSPACLDLIENMLQTDPNKRFTIAQILQHPFFKEALPTGAAIMNDMFQSVNTAIPPSSIAEVEMLIRQAADIDHDVFSHDTSSFCSYATTSETHSSSQCEPHASNDITSKHRPLMQHMPPPALKFVHLPSTYPQACPGDPTSPHVSATANTLSAMSLHGVDARPVCAMQTDMRMPAPQPSGAYAMQCMPDSMQGVCCPMNTGGIDPDLSDMHAMMANDGIAGPSMQGSGMAGPYSNGGPMRMGSLHAVQQRQAMDTSSAHPPINNFSALRMPSGGSLPFPDGEDPDISALGLEAFNWEVLNDNFPPDSNATSLLEGSLWHKICNSMVPMGGQPGDGFLQ